MRFSSGEFQTSLVATPKGTRKYTLDRTPFLTVEVNTELVPIEYCLY